MRLGQSQRGLPGGHPAGHRWAWRRSPSRNPFGAAALQGRRVSSGHGAVRPAPEHCPAVRGHARARGWRRSPIGAGAAVTRGPVQPWKLRSVPAGRWWPRCARGRLPWARGLSGARRSENEADACFELFSSLLVPPNEMIKCLSSFRLDVRLSPASCWQPLEADQTPPNAATTALGLALRLTTLQEPDSANSWQETFLTVLLSFCWFSNFTFPPRRDESCYENMDVWDFGIS